MPIVPAAGPFPVRPQPTVSIREYSQSPSPATPPITTQTLAVGPGSAPYLSAPFSGQTAFVSVRSNCSVSGFIGLNAAAQGATSFALAADGSQTLAVSPGWFVGANTTETDPTIAGP